VKPIQGVRVLDLSRMVAGGVAGMLLADFGAEVVKVEQPAVGDPLRQWTTDGDALWWKVYARNKRFVTLDVKSLRGQEILRTLVPHFDVLVESFIPGTLERLGFGWDLLQQLHPGLILLRISGWGQTGPARTRPGFGTLVEAASGFAAMNGEPDGPPIVPSFPMADTIAGVYAANATMMALYHRDHQHGMGQCIDLALFDSLFSLLGPLPAEYAAHGRVRSREGSRSKNSSPRGCYRTRDGRWIAVSGSTPAMAERFLRAYGLDQMLCDPKFATNEARVKHAAELDAAIGSSIADRTLEENLAIIDATALTAVAVQTIADIERDPHWRERQLTIDVPADGATVRMHNVVPRFSQTPGAIEWAGGALGRDNDAFYRTELGLTCDDVQRLSADAII
jgi:crotonobetainyl-CoA:carnitine CoA-transferase CaiB-like acyl-CoA transferase